MKSLILLNFIFYELNIETNARILFIGENIFAVG